MHSKKNVLFAKIAIVFLCIIVVGLVLSKVIVTDKSLKFKLNGSDEVSIEYNSEYKDDGAIARFNGMNVTDKVKYSSSVDTSKIGDYKVEYNIKFKYLKIDETIERNVHVVDTTKPEINIEGEDEIYAEVFIWKDAPKATAIDNVDGDLTEKIEVENNVDYNTPGDYEIKYKVADSNQNESEKILKVHVKPKYDYAYIDISITNQKLYYFNEGKLVLSSDIVTGLHNGTPVGDFKVLYKARNVNLKGADYVSFVSYWIAFKGNAYGMHDASWRSRFGGSIYTYNGSHGCVNMPTENVRELYNTVSIGTPVYIHY